MSSTYDGKPSTISRPATLAIASSTDTSPIGITTTTPHGLSDGALVEVYGHTANVTANGRWPIVKTGASSFTLTGSTHTTTGGATGHVVGLGTDPAGSLPSDTTDDMNAASVNVMLELLADRTAWLAANGGEYACASQSSYAVDDAGGFPITSPTAWLGPVSVDNTAWHDAGGWGLGGADVIDGDLLELEMTGSLDTITGVGKSLALFVDVHDYGVAASFASAVKCTGSGQYIQGSAGAGVFAFHLRGTFLVSVPHGKQATGFLAAHDYDGGGPTSFKLVGDYSQSMRVWRRRV